MDNRIIPNGLEMRDYLVIFKVLERIKEEVLKGTPSGVVLDQAIKEAYEQGTS
jgi:hypothetical protein